MHSVKVNLTCMAVQFPNGDICTAEYTDFYQNVQIYGKDKQGNQLSYDDEARHIGYWIQKHPELKFWEETKEVTFSVPFSFQNEEE